MLYRTFWPLFGPLAENVRRCAESSGLSSVHVTFNTAEEWAALAEVGFLQRTGIQVWKCGGGVASYKEPESRCVA